MEVITLVLILLSSVGARTIPVHMDQPSELPLVSDGLSNYAKTLITTEFPAGELAESVYVAELGLHVNKNTEDDEKVEDHVYNIMDLDNNVFENMDTHESASNEEKKMRSNIQEEETDSIVGHVEAVEGQKHQTEEEALLVDRVALKGGCIDGYIRVGDECKPKM